MMNRYDELAKQKLSLENKLAEITSEMKKFEKTIIQGKKEKIINLMFELSPFFGNTNVPNLEQIDEYDQLNQVTYFELCQILDEFFKNPFIN